MSDVAKTPREELECKKKYLYEHSMFWECKYHSKNQILEEDVCDLLNKFSSEIEELNISIALFEDDIATKDKKIEEQQSTLTKLKELNDDKGKRIISLIRTNKTLKEENEQLRMKLKGDDYIMVSEMLSNLRKTGICDGCKNKDKPVEWYLERGFSITGQICDRYEPEV